jgi:hypothetical protein
MYVGAVLGEFVRALEAEFDRQRSDQRAGGEGQHRRQHFFGEGEVEPERGAYHAGAGGEQPEKSHLEDIECRGFQYVVLVAVLQFPYTTRQSVID